MPIAYLFILFSAIGLARRSASSQDEPSAQPLIRLGQIGLSQSPYLVLDERSQIAQQDADAVTPEIEGKL